MECVRKRGTCVCGCVFVMCARQKAVTLTTGPVFHSHAKKREFARGPWLLTPLSNRCIGWHARKHSLLCTCSHTLAHTNIANSFSLFIYLGRLVVHFTEVNSLSLHCLCKSYLRAYMRAVAHLAYKMKRVGTWVIGSSLFPHVCLHVVRHTGVFGLVCMKAHRRTANWKVSFF